MYKWVLFKISCGQSLFHRPASDHAWVLRSLFSHSVITHLAKTWQLQGTRSSVPAGGIRAIREERSGWDHEETRRHLEVIPYQSGYDLGESWPDWDLPQDIYRGLKYPWVPLLPESSVDFKTGESFSYHVLPNHCLGRRKQTIENGCEENSYLTLADSLPDPSVFAVSALWWQSKWLQLLLVSISCL